MECNNVHFTLLRICSVSIATDRVTSIAILNHDWIGAELASGGSKTVRLKQASLVHLNFCKCKHVDIDCLIITFKLALFQNSKVVSCFVTFK